ncbi:calcium-dependent lipid-binding family protein isoform X2 [Tasmannia lanceolata]|uniref:calcium-dependent lipid-binding family protein isoform X2 n=1 Tax=Tasmannia lanceolata TaxID=3420 RepID=UPI004063A0CB
MFEAHVLHLLRKYLGEYVQGLSTEALRISVWKGDVVLRDLQLKAEALNSLKLPVTVKAGFVGTITLKVPWKSLGKDPVIVHIDRVFVLAHPAPDGQTLKEEDREKLFEAKLQRIEEAESATLEAKSRQSKTGNSSGGNSWLGSLIATIIGNLKITISNVHIRYEDVMSNPGHPFCCGVTLAKLAAVTMDEQGNETFDTSGALDKLRKSLQLQRLAVYHDSDSPPWKLDKNWDDLDPKEWIEIFEDGINEPETDNAVVSVWALNRKYLVAPINGVLKYHRLGKQERGDPEKPFEKASFVLSDVYLTISEAQYHDGIKLLEVFSRYRTRVDVSHLRPVVPVLEDPYVWWHYAAQAGLLQKKMCYRFSWDRIRYLCQLRRHYIQLYASFLQQSSKVYTSEIRQMERDLDSKVILLWRLLAHAKVETLKSKEAAKQRVDMKRSWWSFGWRSSSEDLSVVNDSEGSQLVEERLTKEEWQAINKILSYQPDEETNFVMGKDMQNMIQFMVNVSISQAAARIISINETEIVCGRFEQLDVCTKLYHRSIQCNVSLRFYGLSAPEGSLAQSVSSERKENALAASFVHSPSGENVDWRLSATIAPCHVTVLMESYERFLEFVKRSNAVSPTVALETATALQMKIEQVSRRAQEQFQMVLEEQSRFALDIDFDAPKVRIPMGTTASTISHGNFLLDFGHFTLHTKEGQCDEQRQSLYSRFYISGRDIAAFFMDGGTDNGNCNLVPSILDGQSSTLPILDRCGMSVVVDQIKIPHPHYPSTRVSVQVPSLGIHFSPERYCRIMDLLSILYDTVESSDQNASEDLDTAVSPWHPSDLATYARILVWRGIGNSVAEWQSCYLVLSGLHLYVLESEVSHNYQRCSSMAGRQVFEVSPASVGGSLFSVAVSFRGIDLQKALESSNTLIIEFQDDEEKATWLKGLTQATYKASAPPSIDILGEPGDSVSDFGGPRVSNFETADLVVNGVLVETKLLIYGKTGEGKRETMEEMLILELLAGGGKVNLVRLGGDLTVKMKLHSLKIKDELQSLLSMSPQYLACSVLKDDVVASPRNFDHNIKEHPKKILEEDDIFKDALPEFMSTPDQSVYPQNLDGPHIVDSTDALFFDKGMTKGMGTTSEMFYEAQDNDTSDFVAVTFLTRHPGSPIYDGIDTQMSIRMSKLEFFCNRPTLVALIEFGLDLSLVNSGLSSENQINAPNRNSSQDREKAEENGRSFVKGLLGYGKGRVVFYLNMDVDSVCVFLNKEDGSQLAMLVQERFLLDLKVHPSSLSIEGTLGNLRLCDLSLGPDHCWGWLCDIRNQGIESLIKFKFQSYSSDDDDYDGHDYSLHGRLSAVRIVFLYKFVQEITAYFMELATPHTEEAIRFVDKVGGFEWLIQKYEIDGASALKLDLSLDTPIIIVPQNSMSKDFMQLDLGQLQVKNSFSWHGCREKDPSAVHLDVLQAEIHGINMAVGVNGLIGNPMIREAQGLHIEVRRSLRDLFRKVPTIAVEVQVGLLHGVMSAKEYNVILDCAYMNISEEPSLPPSFRGNTSHSKDSIRMLADKVNLHSQILLSRTVVLVAVEVNYALLELCIGVDEESPLAQIALEGLWVSYRTTSLSEKDLYVTIPKFSVLDIRPGTKTEMRLMLGSSSDVSKQGNISDSTGNFPTPLSDGVTLRKSLKDAGDMDVPKLTMLLMDYRVRSSSQSFVVRVQQPRVLVVLDFLLAVGEFFVPALGTLTGREELSDPMNDPIVRNDNIVLSTSIYKQRDSLMHLSLNRQLIVDAVGIDEFTYDGCGGTISLSEEIDLKEISASRVQPIIIIGRGKKLRFKNVKIENGALLRKSTYLSNDSSYSVSAEDGVDISLLENFDSEIDPKTLNSSQVSSKESTIPPPYTSSAVSEMQSVTFEAQVVSPEFTFYDSTKWPLDDSLHGEKLLRAKLDLSFMYAAKENDTWVRALVKDLTVEAGSGLVILDPVDISGGYTSVKDKTSVSVISTDMYIHLSLSVISLVLNLQNQASAALQFGNASPLASCTNFDRLWISQKAAGNVPGYNLTFWRPQAPSNYAILGDCVTSRPFPPSQTVMAVSNTYGRVRKPIGFELISLFSNFEGLEGDKSQNDNDNDCSLWLPVAPQGYTTLGCVANIGRQPPPNHIVYCLRSDLVTSTSFSDCIFFLPPNPRVSSGFSIWHLDNAIGTFYAHNAMECPPKDKCWDLHQILFRNPSLHRSSTNKSASYFPVENDYKSQKGSNHSGSSSGWEIIRSISVASNCYMSTPHFERIWWDKGCDIRKPVSIWRPLPRPGFSILGDCIIEGLEPPALGVVFKCDSSGISAKPVQFTKVAHVVGKGIDEVFFWYPIAPPGYASLGCIVSRTDEAPRTDSFCCPRMDLVSQANISDVPISRSSSSKGSHCWSIWKVENQAWTFLARSDLRRPSNRLAYSIGDYVKPKTRENVSGEMKLQCFSLTVLDSLCGMMAPLLNTTITNINLATHGRLESMNAVLISSIAASTFNTQIEAWEPLVEPFDGIFKFETYNTNDHLPSRVGKRVRVAATSAVNLNISAANLETFMESIISWRRQAELEQKSSKLNEEGDESLIRRDGTALSALEEDDFQRVVVENKLGCDIYLKKIEENSETIERLQHEVHTSAWIPPPRFSDRLNVVAESRESRCYVAVQIFESRGLPIFDDGNNHDFFCALRLLIDGHASDQQKLFPQSARTRCVKPFISKTNDMDEGTAKWNEIFIFEVARKGLAKLEVEVTNLASKSGKGEVIGAFSISIGNCVGTLNRVASVRKLHQLADVQKLQSYSLKRRGQLSTDDGGQDNGCLLVSTFYFEKKTILNFQREMESTTSSDREVGFWVGLHPEGPWESFRSLLPLSVVPRTLNETFFAFEVVMKNGKKHAIFRALAVVVNDADVTLEISVCPAALLDIRTLPNSEPNSCAIVTEEIFENQRYQPISGWGNKWTGFLGNDPGHWSTRDFSYSSKDFFVPSLPPGWQWTSSWTVEKSQFVDSDGWAYGPDYQSLKWPPNTSKSSTKSASDFVRRRRWICTRQQVPDRSVHNMRNFVTIIRPRSSTVLPWRSMDRDANLCLQVRPYVESPRAPYTWGHAVTVGSGYSYGNDQPLMDQNSFSRKNTIKSENSLTSPPVLKLNQLEKKDMLLYCNPSNGSKQYFWLSVGTDASVLHTELNSPVYDWKISINSPLKLENKLPCQAEYAIWERTKEGNRVERQHGIISAGNSVFIYSADVQKSIYLTLFVQGGWVLEKDAVLILDLSAVDHVSSFWMVHQQSSRRLRVSIERDFGGTNAAPKTIRLFVPYWIINDSSLPLAYRVVEVEPLDNTETDSLSLSRAVKSPKVALKRPKNSTDGGNPSSMKNIQILETIEDSTPTPIMLSPQDYMSRSGILTFPLRSDASSLSHRVGIAIALCRSEHYSPGISLMELEKKERVDIKAFNSKGSYYKLSALLSMASNRTKVVRFQPQTVFINRVGRSLSLQQCGTQSIECLHPTDPPKMLQWQSTSKSELLKVRLDGFKWSTPFSIDNEGMMCVSLKTCVGNDQTSLRVEVRSGTKSSRHEVFFRPPSLSSPFRIENRSMFLPIRFRQIEGSDDSWRSLPPNASASFFWEDLGRLRLLEVFVDGTDPLKSEKYNIDQISEHQPMQVSGGPVKALCLTVLQEGKMHVVKISDWMPANETLSVIPGRVPLFFTQPSKNDPKQSPSPSECEFHVIVELAELGLSIIDHTPEEILYLSVQNLLLMYSTGLGSGISRFKLRMLGIQLDNQLPLTPMPVLFRPQRIEGQLDYILKLSMTAQSNGSLDFCVYPYLGFQGPENSAFLVNIHEPVIWRLHEMIQQVKPSRVFGAQTTAVSVDPIIQIGLLNISEIRFKVSLSMSPTQRPRGVLGFWLSLMTALGNTEHMPVRINQRFREDLCMRQSALISAAISNIQKDLLSQPLQLLSGVDILGNASSALGHMSKGVAALSMDKKFIQSRKRQESKGVEDIGDVIREGGGALAKGFFRGVTGILTKPLEGAKTSGVEGFVQGVGKGIIGVAAQPVSGVLDLLSKTTEGANAVRMKITSAITSEEQLLRKRLPRVIGGDNLLRPYDEYRAQGQVILQLAECGAFFGQVDLFKIRGKFALSDAYEDHFLLPKGKIIIVTHRRVLLLQQPSNIMAQKRFDPARDPCSVLWDVLWSDLVTMELTHRKKDHPRSSPSQLILYLQSRSTDSKENIRVIKCSRESQQAVEIYSSIEQARNAYGPNCSKEMQKKKVPKPYSPCSSSICSEVVPKEESGIWGTQGVPMEVALSSTFGTIISQMQFEQEGLD